MVGKLKIYSGYDQLPDGLAEGPLLDGCLILEGGGWRCLYTQGVLDVLLQAGVRMQTVVGVSAGAMSSLAYASGQIGKSARINLKYRHDPDYCGLGAFRRDHGVTGFSYFFESILPEMGYDWGRIPDGMRLVAVTTNCNTGLAEYVEYGSGDFERAVAASATVPYVSQPVDVGGKPCLDGGCAVRLPFKWALDQGYKRIIVVRTRDRSYRKQVGQGRLATAVRYGRYPELQRTLDASSARYNASIELLDSYESARRIFVQAPEEPVEVARFEGDMEKLGALYWTGYREMAEHLEDLVDYLEL